MKQDFTQYVKDHLKEYLPYDYADAIFETISVKKSNKRNLKGLIIRNNIERSMPTLYLNEYEKRYKNGESLKKIMEEIADLIIEEDHFDIPQEVDNKIDVVLNYEKIKPMLALRLCDIKDSKEFLEDKPYTPFGNLAITYRIQMFNQNDLIASAPIDNNLLAAWNISKEQLHRDSLKAESDRSKIWLYENSIFSHLSKDKENVFNSKSKLEKHQYVLTNEQVTNGACAIVQKGVLTRLGDLLNDNFYIFPSSIHEIIIIPQSMTRQNLTGIDEMLQKGNKILVSIDDKLSDHAMLYDRKSKKLKYNNY